jgi:hypothetical protein
VSPAVDHAVGRITSPSDDTMEQIQINDPARSGQLRDYFSRLGAVTLLQSARTLDVDFPAGVLGDGESVQAFLSSWAERNGALAATLLDRDAPMAQVFDLNAVLQEVRTPPPAQPRRIGDLLVEKGLITAPQLEQALAESKQTRDLLGRVLLRRGYLFDEELARTLAEQHGLPFVSLYRVGVDARVVRLVPREVGLRCAAIPVRLIDGVVQVAFADPTDEEALDGIARHLDGFSAAIGELSDIETAWRAAVAA